MKYLLFACLCFTHFLYQETLDHKDLEIDRYRIELINLYVNEAMEREQNNDCGGEWKDSIKNKYEDYLLTKYIKDRKRHDKQNQ